MAGDWREASARRMREQCVHRVLVIPAPNERPIVVPDGATADAAIALDAAARRMGRD